MCFEKADRALSMWCSRRGSGTIRVSLDIIVLESLIGLALASPIRREPEGVVLVARVALAIEAYVGGKAAEPCIPASSPSIGQVGKLNGRY